MADDGWQTVGAGGTVVSAAAAPSASAASGSKKKNNKKKKKKTASSSTTNSEAPSSVSTAPDAAHAPAEEKLPRIPVENQWETVVDTKREKYEARRRRKLTDAEREAEEKAAKDAEARQRFKDMNGSTEKKSKKKNKGSRVANPDEPALKMPKSKSSNKKKQSKSSGAPRKPKTASEIVGFVSNILDSAPTDYMSVAAIGDRLQSITNVSWNKHYKPAHGSLKAFVASKGEFHVDQADNVYLKSRWNDIVAQKQELRRQKEEKRQAKASGRKHARDAPAVRHAQPAPASSGGGVMTAVLVLVLVAALTLFAVNGFDLEATIRYLQNLF